MVRDSQDGLEWDDRGLNLVPGWRREPSLEAIESVCRRQLGICPEETCTVSFYAAGCMDDLDNEGKNELYWIHLMDHEVTRLQEVYDAKLRQLWPDRPVEESRVKVDFFEAMSQCSAGFRLKQVGTWVDTQVSAIELGVGNY